jgi:hypothetical protein
MQDGVSGCMTEKLVTLNQLMTEHLTPDKMDGQQTAYLAQHNIFDQIPALRSLVRLVPRY